MSDIVCEYGDHCGGICEPCKKAEKLNKFADKLLEEHADLFKLLAEQEEKDKAKA